MTYIPDKPVIFFDGVCNLCNGFVQFMLKRDHKKKFYYVPLQSKAAEKLLKDHPVEPDALESIVLLDENQLAQKSGAILGIANNLGGVYAVLNICRILPGFLLDKLYDIIAANRYSWFGKRDTCRMPTEDEKEVFFDEDLPPGSASEVQK